MPRPVASLSFSCLPDVYPIASLRRVPRFPPGSNATPDGLSEAAILLRRLLTLVETGELEATTPNARAVLRRLGGATIAVELATGVRPALRSEDKS